MIQLVHCNNFLQTNISRENALAGNRIFWKISTCSGGRSDIAAETKLTKRVSWKLVGMSSTMLPKDQLKLLHQFVGIIKGNPKILLAPELKFFKDWLERLVHHRNIASFFAIFATLQLHWGPLRMFLLSLNLFGFFFELYPVILNMTWKFLSPTLSFHICYIATSALVWCYLLTEGINLSS